MLPSLPQAEWSRRHADHLLWRVASGGTPAQREALYQLGAQKGVAAAVASLVDAPWVPDDLPFPPWVDTAADPNGTNSGLHLNLLRGTVVQWFLRHATELSPLGGRMLAFWLDHFPIDRTTLVAATVQLYFFRHLDVLRRHALGNFGDLVRAVSWSEGMMRMLDLYRSSRNSVNENFARELLELFTLGVDGGYTEQDVSTLASVFTGRRLKADTNNVAGSGWDYRPSSSASLVDRTAKTFLGTTIPAHTATPDSPDQGDQAIAIILGRVQCARHLIWKLWRFFVAPEIDTATLNSLALRWRDTYAYELRPLLREIFTSAAFFDPAVVGHMVKSPPDLLLSMVRTLGTPLPPPATARMLLDDAGFALFEPPSIEGWPEPDGVGNAWLGGGTSLFRANLPTLLLFGDRNVLSSPTQNIVRIESVTTPDWDELIPRHLRDPAACPLLLNHLQQRFLPFHPLRPSQARVLADHQRREVPRRGELGAAQDLLRLLLALPEFQLH